MKILKYYKSTKKDGGRSERKHHKRIEKKSKKILEKNGENVIKGIKIRVVFSIRYLAAFLDWINEEKQDIDQDKKINHDA